MAQKLGVDVGDRLFLTIQCFTGDIGYDVYFVQGVFRTGMGEQDKSVAYLPINSLREVMASDVARFQSAVHEVTVLLKPNAEIEPAMKYLANDLAGYSQSLEIMDWQELQPGLRSFVEIDSYSMYIMMIFIFVVVATGIMNTFMMSVFERIREFGILMSLGSRPSSIFKLVMIESAFLGVIGAIGGLFFGIILYWINMIYPWNFSSYQEMGEIFSFDWSMKIYPMLVWPNMLRAALGIFVVTLLAALWPAIKAVTLKPVEALRHV
jgi:ABC-type lipoprotein release transport system permease subunit